MNLEKIGEGVLAPKISFGKIVVDDTNVIAKIRTFIRSRGGVIEKVRKREKAHVERDLIDNGLRIAFGGDRKLRSYRRDATRRFGNPFPNLAIRLTSTADSTAKLIGSNRRGAARRDTKSRPYNLYEL